MRKNQADPTLRVAAPVPFFDNSGQLATGLTFLTGSGEVEVYRSSTNTFVAATNNAYELADSGCYALQLTQAETNYDSLLGVKLKKSGYPDQFFWIPIDTAAASQDLAAIEELLARNNGLLHGNSMIDGGVGATQPTYSAKGLLTGARVRVFASAGDLALATKGAADDADGEIYRYTITGEDNGLGKMASYKMSEDL